MTKKIKIPSVSKRVDEITKDVRKLMAKYSIVPPDQNFTQYGDDVSTDKGFYLILVTRDESRGARDRLVVTELAQHITLEDLVNSLMTVVNNHAYGINTIDYLA